MINKTCKEADIPVAVGQKDERYALARASAVPPAGCVIRHIEPAAYTVNVMRAPLKTVISFGFFGISGLFLLLSALYVAAYSCSDLTLCSSPIPGHLLGPAGLFLVAGILLLGLSARPLPSAH